MIRYDNSKPTLYGYKRLFESTGWVSRNSLSDAVLQAAIDHSWYWIAAYDGSALIGSGRLVSDGALYAFVCDLIVDPRYQRQGIGAAILERLKKKCSRHGLRRVWLFAASGKTSFYLKHGFEIRANDAPGMQMK